MLYVYHNGLGKFVLTVKYTLFKKQKQIKELKNNFNYKKMRKYTIIYQSERYIKTYFI